MRRIFPFPLFSVALFAIWLLLNQSVSPGHLFAGALIGILGPIAMTALELPRAKFRRVRAILKLLWLWFEDVVRSNNAVAMIVLHPNLRGATSGFVDIPLELRSRYGLALLAIIITSTPGTLWTDYDTATGVMRMHVLDLIDKAAWVRRIKERYESLLLEIFE
nr:MAG: Na+/H+ antiporter subunit E [Pseudomonadota bacterium]